MSNGILGTTLSFSFRADERGTLAATKSDAELIAQAITDLIETRQGERVMLPNYGINLSVFDPLDAGFTARLAFVVEEQIKNYIPAVEEVFVESGSLNDRQFTSDSLPNNHKAAIRINYRTRTDSVPRELIYPTWRLINGSN